ncbi:class I SAM-dependent methyltransferase [Desulfovibrio legallii]|jgi:hypothetical protein|uniref:Class I SAM-dependent methyltransferase n=1 Tax=Desulfovibrio legallii TaxID=571438 RepID=A0A1G7L2U3_9BACT|nr:class I SAM-dependent methyltransferase [Desulfovibrio legallii]SDF43410.1 hypothetical protein SAMN05192586_10588 [Desulfovibrio legallii]
MLWENFLSNKGNLIHKWKYYFPAYERHFHEYINKSIVFFEIGVSKGGSLDLWTRYFGPLATIVGIDIDPSCVKFDNRFHKVRIGDQSDKKFLQSLIEEFGRPDIVIDDGSHKMHDMRNSFLYLFPLLNNNGVYLVEDLHTCYWPDWGGGLKKPGTFIEFCKELLDILHAQHNGIQIPPTHCFESIFSMTFYDSLVFFEKKLKSKNVSMMSPAPK